MSSNGILIIPLNSNCVMIRVFFSLSFSSVNLEIISSFDCRIRINKRKHFPKLSLKIADNKSFFGIFCNVSKVSCNILIFDLSTSNFDTNPSNISNILRSIITGSKKKFVSCWDIHVINCSNRSIYCKMR